MEAPRTFCRALTTLTVISCALSVNAAPQSAAIAAKLAPSMMAVARLTAEQTWSPRFDQIVQINEAPRKLARQLRANRGLAGTHKSCKGNDRYGW